MLYFAWKYVEFWSKFIELACSLPQEEEPPHNQASSNEARRETQNGTNISHMKSQAADLHPPNGTTIDVSPSVHLQRAPWIPMHYFRCLLLTLH